MTGGFHGIFQLDSTTNLGILLAIPPISRGDRNSFGVNSMKSLILFFFTLSVPFWGYCEIHSSCISFLSLRASSHIKHQGAQRLDIILKGSSTNPVLNDRVATQQELLDMGFTSIEAPSFFDSMGNFWRIRPDQSFLQVRERSNEADHALIKTFFETFTLLQLAQYSKGSKSLEDAMMIDHPHLGLFSPDVGIPIRAQAFHHFSLEREGRSLTVADIAIREQRFLDILPIEYGKFGSFYQFVENSFITRLSLTREGSENLKEFGEEALFHQSTIAMLLNSQGERADTGLIAVESRLGRERTITPSLPLEKIFNVSVRELLGINKPIGVAEIAWNQGTTLKPGSDARPLLKFILSSLAARSDLSYIVFVAPKSENSTFRPLGFSEVPIPGTATLQRDPLQLYQGRIEDVLKQVF